MPQKKLNQRAVDQLRHEPPRDSDRKRQDVTYWDTMMRGFGVRISPQNRKTYLAQYRVQGAVNKQGKPLEVCETFGTADKLTLIEAQRQARASFALAREGIHPVLQRKQKLQAAQASVEERAFTFERLAERYMTAYVEVNSRPSTVKEARRLLTRAMRMRYSDKLCFGDLPARAITADDIDALIAAALANRNPANSGKKTKGRVEANNLLAALQRCFKWGGQARLISADPARDILKPLKHLASRERYLDEDEIRLFWRGCAEIGWPFGPLFQLLLLTGQRLNEVGGMRWSELNLDKRNWVIPAARAKNDKTHDVALSDLAIEIIEALPHVDDEFVFPAHGVASKPVVGFHYAKGNLFKSMGIPDWRLHDLRRTCTTGMCELGVPPHVADKVLNHTAGTIRGVQKTYNRFEYLDERRDALCRWGRYVEALVYAERAQTNVVALAR